MAAKTLYLIRHAQPDFPNGEKMCLGRKSDLPLSAYGFEQADSLAAALACAPIEAVYTSPLLRARQTAAPIAADRCPLIVLDDLIELDGGEWEGLTFTQIRTRYPQHFVRGSGVTCPPGGERDEDGLHRAMAALEYVLARTERCAALVAHSGVNRLLLCALTGRPLEDKKQTPQDYAAISALEYDGSWHVSHLGLSAESIRAHVLR